MNFDKLFIDGYDLPQPLPKEELYDLIKDGSKDARDKIAIHNIRLVFHEVISKFKNVNYDKQDLISIGNLGLAKAINTYDLSKGYEFTTYAAKCIDNEILMFLRKLKRKQDVDSLDIPVYQDKEGSELKLGDILSDDRDLVEDYENTEIHEIIREVIKELPNRNREIVMLYFGFYDDRRYSQYEIADKFGISQVQVSRIITKIVKKIGEFLESEGLIELNFRKRKLTKY